MGINKYNSEGYYDPTAVSYTHLINYTFANGETSDVEVREEIGNLILDSRREESNQDRKERYHCYSLDAAEYEGEDYADGSTPEMELFRQLENQRIKKAFEQLSEVQMCIRDR